MKTIFKIIAVLIGLFILANGVLFMFKPELVMDQSQISASSAFGLSTVRGLIGGSMLAAGTMTLIAIAKSKLDLLHPAVIILLGWTLGRIVSLLADGFNMSVFVGGIAISLVMAVLLILTHKVLSKGAAN